MRHTATLCCHLISVRGAGEQWHIIANDPAIRMNRAATRSFVYFELDGVDSCIGGVRELYSDGAGFFVMKTSSEKRQRDRVANKQSHRRTHNCFVAGRPCFVHDRYLSCRDLEIIGDATVTKGNTLPWDNASELAWCPMLGSTYVRNIQGLCTLLPRLETGATADLPLSRYVEP